MTAVHTDSDEMPPVTAIWALLDSGLKPGDVQPRKWLLNLRSTLVELNTSLASVSRREDEILATRDQQTRARCLQILGYWHQSLEVPLLAEYELLLAVVAP